MIAIVSELIRDSFFEKTKIETLSLKAFENLSAPVSTHADMLLCVIEDNVFCYNKYYEENIDLFGIISSFGYNIIKTEKECEKKYPFDIGLNVLVMGKRIFCNSKYTASEILDFAKEKEYKIIDVKQGYSACSTLALDETHAISADASLIKALRGAGIDVLEISPEGISLEGYNCGFIGGACGVCENNVYLFGQLDAHPDGKEITDFLNKLNFEKIEIFCDKMHDFGGIKFL